MSDHVQRTGTEPAGAPIARLTHVVAMVDVDLVQINFTAYFRWMDLGYDALLRQIGHPLSGILGAGFATPAVDARCRYVRPVGLDDCVETESWIARAARTSYVVGHRFHNRGELVAEGQVTHVWITCGPPAAPASLPAWLREAGQALDPR